MHAIKLTGLATPITKAGQYFKRTAQQDVHLTVLSIRDIDKLLLGVH